MKLDPFCGLPQGRSPARQPDCKSCPHRPWSTHTLNALCACNPENFVSDTMLQSTLRELRMLLSHPRLWMVFALVVGLFVLTGPFGTYERLALPTRLGYWLMLHAATWSTALVFVALFDAALASRISNRLYRMLIGAIVAALPIGLAITVINAAILHTPLNFARIGGNVLISAPISIGFCLLSWLSMSGGKTVSGDDAQARPDSANPCTSPETETGTAERPAAPPSPQAGPPTQRPALLDRLPANKRGALIRLEVQDHYVRAVTTKGSELLLMRLGDAIAETGGNTGLQIHRSHWVGDQGIERISRQTGKNPRLQIETADGETLPVSRSHLDKVRARWGRRIAK